METILLLKDDLPGLDHLSVILRAHGYRVLTGDHGGAIVGQALPEDIDLVITDLIMPHIGGLEVIQDIVARHPAVPVIALSRELDDEDNRFFCQCALKLGAACAVAGPVEDSVLLRKVTALLTEARTTQ